MERTLPDAVRWDRIMSKVTHDLVGNSTDTPALFAALGYGNRQRARERQRRNSASEF